MGFAEAMNRRTNSTNPFLVTSSSFPLRITFFLVFVLSCLCLSHTGFMWSQLYWGQIPAVTASLPDFIRTTLLLQTQRDLAQKECPHAAYETPSLWLYSYLVCAGRDWKPWYHTARAPVSTPFTRLLSPTAGMPMQNITGLSCCAQRLMRGLVYSCSATWDYHKGLFIWRSQA